MQYRLGTGLKPRVTLRIDHVPQQILVGYTCPWIMICADLVFQDHTADVILHSWGRTLEQALEQCCVTWPEIWNFQPPYWETFLFFNKITTGRFGQMSFLSKWMTFWLRIMLCWDPDCLVYKDIVYCMYPWIIFIFQCSLFSQQNSRTTFESVLANVSRHCDHWDKQNAARRKSFTKSPVVRCVSFPIWRIWTRWVYWLQWKFMQLAMTWRICSIISWMSC